MTKRNTKSNDVPTIVLKTLHDDIMRDNANATITTKKMRARLRVDPLTRDIHVRNSSWIFTQSQYDVVRSMFDANYRAKIERANKRNAKSNVRAKRVTKSNVAPIVETNDENA